MKKFGSLLLCILMILVFGCSALAEESTYDTHIDFTASTYYSIYQAAAGYDVDSEEYVQWVLDKFNVSIDAWLCEESEASEKTILWISSGTMPDVMLKTSLSYSEVLTYAEQGLIQALPEDWEERWPNLARMVELSGVSAKCEVDGLTYAIPHAVFGNFLEMETCVTHWSLYFRKDWAAEVGMEDFGSDYTVTLSELKEYLTKVAEAGLCDNSYLDGTTQYLTLMFQVLYGINTAYDFIYTDDGYIWVCESENYVEYIETMQEWYSEGLINPDFYVAERQDVINSFKEGLTSAFFCSAGIGNVGDVIDGLIENLGLGDETDEEVRQQVIDDYLGVVVVTTDDGTVYAQGDTNNWTYFLFSPDADEETMERILDMIDWFCTPEGEASVLCGIPDVDFTIDEDNNVTILNEGLLDGTYVASPSEFFYVWGFCGDDLDFANGVPGTYSCDQDLVNAVYAVKFAGTILEVDDVVMTCSTEAMSNYSVDIDSKVAELIVSTDDVATELAEFIETYSSIWEPVVEDLNEAIAE